MNNEQEILAYLSGFVTSQRLAVFDRVLDSRTKYITVVLEDIFQPQNASAVLRTCDCFGIQNVHIIENRNTFEPDREVAMGASKWLTLIKHNKKADNSLDAIRRLKKEGYRIVATTPHRNEQLLPEFDLAKGKTALVFGSELPGVSETIMHEADEFLKIPMFGFTESFNISVSAAIILHYLTEKLHRTNNIEWHLNENEKRALKIEWLRKTIKSSRLIEKQFNERKIRD